MSPQDYQLFESGVQSRLVGVRVYVQCEESGADVLADVRRDSGELLGTLEGRTEDGTLGMDVVLSAPSQSAIGLEAGGQYRLSLRVGSAGGSCLVGVVVGEYAGGYLRQASNPTNETLDLVLMTFMGMLMGCEDGWLMHTAFDESPVLLAPLELLVPAVMPAGEHPLLLLKDTVVASGGVLNASFVSVGLPWTYRYDAVLCQVFVTVPVTDAESGLFNGTEADVDVVLEITDKSRQCVQSTGAGVAGRGCTSKFRGTMKIRKVHNCPEIATASLGSRLATTARVTWSEPSCRDCVFTGNRSPGRELPMGVTLVDYVATGRSAVQSAETGIVCRFSVSFCGAVGVC
jgi:hypothetical protein